jgi:hypothetical protein
VDFFDDDAPKASATGQSATTQSPSRRRSNPRRTRTQRIVVVAVVIFLIVFVLALWVRSCQHSRKVASYRDYFAGVTTAITDSTALGKQLDQLVKNPTRYSRKELVAKLQELSAKQDEIAARADRLQAPGSLATEQAAFAEGMHVRADGFKQLETAMLGILSNKKVSAAQLAALAGYFGGPDAYYMSRVYLPARNVMSQQGVSDVAVPTATWYLHTRAFDLAALQQMLSSVSSSTKLSGIHGVALVSVTAQPGDVALTQGHTASVAASADLAFDVVVMNQGDVTENDVPVSIQIKPPGGSPITQTSSIATLPSGKSQKVTVQGFAIPAEALSKVSTVTVTAGPVKGERVKTNNTSRYKILLQLQ